MWTNRTHFIAIRARAHLTFLSCGCFYKFYSTNLLHFYFPKGVLHLNRYFTRNMTSKVEHSHVLTRNMFETSLGQMQPGYTSPEKAWPGKALDGSDPFTGPLPLAGTETLRRSLYLHSHVHTSYGRSDEPASRAGRKSLCWWLCSGPVQDP